MTARFTLLRALLDRAHPARHEYARFRATPEEAAEAVQAARAKLGAAVQGAAKPGENPAGQCGPECAEGHVYAYRCALKPPPISPWKILGAWQAAPAPTSPDRRQRYADALREVLGDGPWDVITHRATDAVMAVRDRELEQARAERDRYRLAWRSARERATAYGEGITRLCGDRDSYKGWMQEAETAIDRAQKIPRIPHASQQDGDLGRAYTRGWQSVITALDGALAGRPTDPEADTYPPTGAALDGTEQPADTPHVYLSTGCLHGQHTYCQNRHGVLGVKRPARCKWCSAPCVCHCHHEPATPQPDLVHPDGEQQASEPPQVDEPDGDACRVVHVDGEPLRVRGAREMTEQERGYLGEIITAARNRYAAEHPDQPTPEADRA